MGIGLGAVGLQYTGGDAGTPTTARYASANGGFGLGAPGMQTIGRGGLLNGQTRMASLALGGGAMPGGVGLNALNGLSMMQQQQQQQQQQQAQQPLGTGAGGGGQVSVNDMATLLGMRGGTRGGVLSGGGGGAVGGSVGILGQVHPGPQGGVTQQQQEQGPFQVDSMADFPSLTSRVAALSLGGDGDGGARGFGADMHSIIHHTAAPSQPQPPQGLQQQQQAQPGEFAIQQEDFPALPGTAAPPPPSPKLPSTPHNPSPLLHPISASSSLLNNDTITEEAQKKAAEQYGLRGLLSVIRMTDPDLNTLALGSDLTTLGLNLNSTECLYTTFASPWAEGPTTRDPKFFLPQCYNIQKQTLKLTHFSKFAVETLFYIFYAMPKDALQAYAAEELYRREWRFHKEMKLWIKEEAAGFTGKVQYFYFDINHWEKRLFPQTAPANIAAIATGLLTEEDVRMHFPPVQAAGVGASVAR